VYQGDHHFSFWVAVFFASETDRFTSSLIKMGGEYRISQEVKSEIRRLCDEGFAVVSGMEATFLNGPAPHEGF